MTPEDQVIMKAVAIGWPDNSFPANAVVSERKTVDEAATFVGFPNKTEPVGLWLDEIGHLAAEQSLSHSQTVLSP